MKDMNKGYYDRVLVSLWFSNGLKSLHYWAVANSIMDGYLRKVGENQYKFSNSAIERLIFLGYLDKDKYLSDIIEYIMTD